MTLKMGGLRRFRAGLPGAIDAGAQDIAEAVLAAREPLVPVDEGDLRDSGHIVGEGTGTGQRQVVEGSGLPDARAIYTEYGVDAEGHYQDAQPHMTPAAEQTDAGAIMAARLRTLASQSNA